MVFIFVGCDDNTFPTNVKIDANDQTLNIYIPNEFKRIEIDTILTQFGAQITNDILYQKDNTRILIGIEKEFNSKPYYYWEMGEDEKFYSDKKYGIILSSLVKNYEGNYKNIKWKDKSIKNIGGKKSIYISFNYSSGSITDVLWFTDSLYFVKLNYSTNEEQNIHHENELVQILKSVDWD